MCLSDDLSALPQTVLKATPWSHPDFSATQALSQKMDHLSQRVLAVLAEEDLCDDLFSGEFYLRDVPPDFHATRLSRRLILHCDIAELVLQSPKVGFHNRIGAAPLSLGQRAGCRRVDMVGATGKSPAYASLLSHYNRDSLVPRGLHIFVFTDCVCFGLRAIDTTVSFNPRKNSKDTRETWCFDQTIGLLHPLAVERTAFSGFPNVLVLHAKPVVQAKTAADSRSRCSATSNTEDTSIVSLVPPASNHQEEIALEDALALEVAWWIQLEDALTMSMAQRTGIQSRPTAVPSDRLDRSIDFWLEKISDATTDIRLRKKQARAKYFL